MFHKPTVEPKAIPFILQLVDAAKGEQVRFYKALSQGNIEIKIFTTNTMLITAEFNQRELVELKSRIRSSSESLLGIESTIRDQLQLRSDFRPKPEIKYLASEFRLGN